MNKISDMREHYDRSFLVENNIKANPIEQFQEWFEEARQGNLIEPNAMILSTVNKELIPSSRTILLKEVEPRGFVFYTNYKSEKGKDIAGNPNVSLLFLWLEMERQVRISGIAKKVSRDQSEEYFHIRPKGSQIGAWASPQSEVITDRSVLDERKSQLEEEYSNSEKLPLPDFWGGYIVEPNKIEFWQGRPNRLHDRLRYTLDTGNWKIERLAP